VSSTLFESLSLFKHLFFKVTNRFSFVYLPAQKFTASLEPEPFLGCDLLPFVTIERRLDRAVFEVTHLKDIDCRATDLPALPASGQQVFRRCPSHARKSALLSRRFIVNGATSSV
jgi:hypothetical protein